MKCLYIRTDCRALRNVRR